MKLNKINFNRGNPDPATFPVKELQQAAAAAFAGPDLQMLQYGSYLGYQPLRELLADTYAIDSSQIVITNSSLEGLNYASRTLISGQSSVVVESPTYDRALDLFSQNGCKVHGVDMLPDGPDMDMFGDLLRNSTVSAFYTVPDFQNPTGWTTSAEKRKQISQLASQYGFTIIEDSPYKALRYFGDDIPSYYELIPELTLHISSFSKVVSPGLRVSYIFGPADKMEKIQKMSERTCIHSGNVNAAILYHYLQQGCFDENVEKIKSLYSRRLDILTDAIHNFLPKDIHFHKPEGGYFGSLFILGLKSDIFRKVTIENNLELPVSESFFVTPQQKTFIRIPFSCQQDAQIPEAIKRLADVIEMARHDS